MKIKQEIELNKKLKRLKKIANLNSKVNFSKKIKSFIYENWKIFIAFLFSVCLIIIPWSYLNHINSIYLLQDVLSSSKMWVGAFYLLIFVLFFCLFMPLSVPSMYVWILNKLKIGENNKEIQKKLTLTLLIPPMLSLILIWVGYFYTYKGDGALKYYFLIMLLSPSILCIFYCLGSKDERIVLPLTFASFLVGVCLISNIILNYIHEDVLISFICVSIISIMIYWAIYSLNFNRLGDVEVLNKDKSKARFHDTIRAYLLLAGVVFGFNTIFFLPFLLFIASISPNAILNGGDYDQIVRNLSQAIYSTLILVIYIFSILFHSFFNFISRNKLIKTIVSVWLVGFLLFIMAVFFMDSYPIFIINSMRNMGYIEDKRDARWYALDERFIQWGRNQEIFVKNKMIYSVDPICLKKNYELIDLIEKGKDDVSYQLYGYMAWNLGQTKVFCPVTVSIGSEVGEKCWHIPSQYLYLMPK